MILGSKSIYLRRGIQCCICKNLYITQSQSHKHVIFLPRRAKIGSVKARDMILVPTTIFIRAREFNGASRKSLKSRIAGFKDFYRYTIKFPGSSRNLWTAFFLLRLTPPTPGIKLGCRIEVCSYSLSFVSATLETLPR